MSSPEVALCGLAMDLLGVTPITSFEEGSPQAGVAARLYPAIRDQLLSSHPWHFAQRVLQLARRADPPRGWSHAFAPPADMLELRGLWPSASLTQEPVRMFDWQDGQIVAEHPDLWALYLARPAVPNWPAPFAALVRYALAAEFALVLTERPDRAEHWRRVAYGLPSEAGRGGQFRAAATADAQVSRAVRITHMPLHAARRGG